MDEETVAPAIEEELEDRARRGEMEIERAIDKLELPSPAGEQTIQRREEWLQREGADGNIERGEAEFAGKRTAARGFDVENPVRDVVIAIAVLR